MTSYYAIENKNFVLDINGLEHNDNYLVTLYNEQDLISEYQLKEEKLIIPYKDIKAFSGKITAYISKNNVKYDKVNFYINTVISR